MPPTYMISPDVVCMNRAKKDAETHYKKYIESLEEILKNKNSTKIRLEINRAKQWIKKYEEWAIKWHKKHYIKLSDCYSNIEDSHISERVRPPSAPFLDLYSELT